MTERSLTTLEVMPAEREKIVFLRELHKREVNDIVLTERGFAHRGWYDPYLIRKDERLIGYGLVNAYDDVRMLVEFSLLPFYRADALAIEASFLDRIAITHISADTRDRFFTLMLYDFCEQISSEDITFRDEIRTHDHVPGVTLRPVTEADVSALFPILRGPEGHPFEMDSEEELARWIHRGVGWLLLDGETIVGVGAIFDDFNLPFAELGMMVPGTFRNRGYGTYILQELKTQCYRRGLIPTSRCDVRNVASRRTHLKAGFLPSGRLLDGVVVRRSA
jgi:RimJ/RimL family protein N-acetyltransferase